MTKLSVIVPVYNAEPYLHRCIDSLLNQGLSEEEMEIICVDDGSTDDSLSVLQGYACSNPSVKVFSQSHSGLGMTRNIALKYVSGEIITFCDADDYLIPNGLRYVLDHFWDDLVDVVCYGSTTLDKKKLKHWKENNDVTGEVLFEGLGREAYERNPKYFVWNTLIRRSFMEEHQLNFRSMIMTEDSYFMLELMMANPRTRDVSSNIYRYTVNQGQLTRQRDGDTMRKCIESYARYIARLKHYGLSKVVRQQCVPFYSRILSAKLDKEEYNAVRKVLQDLDLKSYPYALYVPMSWLFRRVFVPHVLPRLSRG